MVEGYDDPSEFLAALATRPRLLGLGEPTHGVEAFPLLRNEFFKHLVEHQGFTAIAIESDSVAGLMVDDFVTIGRGELDEVMRKGFSHGFGESPANRELVEWMRDHGKGLRFFGFDAPIEMMGAYGPRTSLAALHAYLAAHLDPILIPYSLETINELAGDDAAWPDPEAAMDPSKSAGASPEAIRLRLIADDLQALLVSESPRLQRVSEPETLWRARLHARTATGLLRYHATMAEASPNRVARLSTLPRERSLMRSAEMAAALETRPKETRPKETKLKPRTSGNPGYFPLDPDHLSDSDGILFLKEVNGGS